MVYSKGAVPMGIKPKNKLRRQSANLATKKAKEEKKRDDRLRRRREEDKNPALRAARQAANVPKTIDAKRTWDEGVGDEEDALGWAVDVEQLAKRRKIAEETAEEEGVLAALRKRDGEVDELQEEEAEEMDSMLDSDSDSDSDSDDSDAPRKQSKRKDPPKRETSPGSTSTATNLDISPDFLKKKFPALFEPAPEPKILITNSIHSSLHAECEILTDFFPNSKYIRRTAHAHAHKYSVKEIAAFATARGYTTLVILMQDMHQKKPSGLDVVHLPTGPHFHFSISNWIEGKKLPGHGNSTGHIPELILNGFKTPLGLLTAHLFKNLYPPQPELAGRTVVTLHNQRDYIFVRRHRYVFREKRESEKSVVGTDGKLVKGVENLRTGLQELGPRFTLKLRRIDRGIQWKSGQEWEWKPGMEKERTRFNM
ncbi:Brix-domain-containing protein [Pleomassaria siparia CBS 279.74]|uniref:Brix-domain-containing protein n=1 Tax=Pleomassaria siparia CBS 279.74 TaxID=1314801 RepID=A0A6G1KRF4_9PLEO|nr:Brix-domain-containing protein [Pleomassaria siparia CBS 279.74]